MSSPLTSSHVQTLMDERVEIHGTSRADMNGKRGVATDFHWYEDEPTKSRYTVKLDSGEAFKFKAANVRAEGTGGGSGGVGASTGKAKGRARRGGQRASE